MRRKLLAHFEALRACARCPRMHGPPVHGRPVVGSRVLLVGQAPGAHEPLRGRPFAHTAGKTLFKWLHEATGLDEEQARDRIFFSAVCRCFPGKKAAGGDRVPDDAEIAACAPWLDAEIALLRPTLVLAVGKLAIGRFLPCERLEDVVGDVWPAALAGRRFDVLPLPHPSGASTWHHRDPGKQLLARALRRLGAHDAVRAGPHVRPV